MSGNWEYQPRLQKQIDSFADRVFEDPLGVMDQDVHHEFASGMHGKKLDFDKIETGTDFYLEWVALYGRAMFDIYGDETPDLLIGVANGTNRLAYGIGELTGITSVTTTKADDGKSVFLQPMQKARVSRIGGFALVVEDVGTTGGTTLTAVNSVLEAGASRVEVMNGWQRSQTLPKLDAEGIVHRAVVHEPMPNFSPADCQSLSSGLCAQGIRLVRHGED